ncbi:MAG: choice-of-anchor A family protein, partial [Caldilineaceae bacterium]|nr:choice-of-anchor A family protein [Caldilineaceae bacterium]
SLQGGRTVNYNGGAGCGLISDSSLSAAGITAYMQSASASLASIPANNVDPAVNAGGNLMFNVASKTANGLAIFDITGAQLFNSANGVIEFTNSANATTILVNVSGSSMNWTHGNMGNWLTSYSSNITKVIWNFHQATSINTNSRRFAGAILAPYADMNAGSGNLEGSVVVKNLVNAGEIHDPVFALANSTPLTTACGSTTPTATPTNTPPPTNTPVPSPTLTPTPGVNDDTIDSDFNPTTGRAPALISSLDNPTVDGGFIIVDAGPQSAIINVSDNQNSTYEITLVSVSGPTWTYRVREVSGHNLDYWSLGIANCLDNIVSYTPADTFSNGTDGSTGFTGAKWTVANSFSDGTFSFTLDNTYQAGARQALVKSGNNSAEVTISGPDCSLIGDPQMPEPTPVPDDSGDSDGNCVCEGGDAGFEYGVQYTLHEPESNAPGNYGWIRWSGDTPSTTDLAYNIDHPEESDVVYIGDWVQGTTGIKNSSLLETAFEQWLGKIITIPIYNDVTGTGSNVQYRICTFATFKLISYDRSTKTITGQFVQTLTHSDFTDEEYPDVGARDVRMVH